MAGLLLFALAFMRVVLQMRNINEENRDFIYHLHESLGFEEYAIWSSEFQVEKSKDPRTVWVFRIPEVKWIKHCICVKFKGKSPSVISWGSLYGNSHG